MDPITMMLLGTAVPQVVSGVAGFLNSKEASKLTNAERKKFEDLVAKIQEPNFDMSYIAPGEFKVLQKYVPEVAPMVSEANPQLLSGQNEQSKEGRAAQKQVLEQLLSSAKSGSDPMLELAQRKAARDAQAGAASTRASLDESFARRGVAPGSAMQYGAALQGNADAQLQQALAGEQAAANAYQNRQSALGQAAGLGGQIYSQGMNIEQQNASLMNDFNRRLAERQQAYGMNRQNTLNDAQRYNIGNDQSIYNQNVDRGYQAQQGFQDRTNSLKGQQFNNQIAKTNLVGGVVNNNIQGINQQTDAKNKVFQAGADAVGAGVRAYQSANTPAAPNYQQENDELKKKLKAYGIN